MKKRLISMLLVLVMVLSLFAGCGKKEAKGDNVLTVGMPQNASITSYEDNALTKYIEKELGIDIQFKFFASGASEQLQQLTLMCSGNETLPDVLCGFISMKQSTVNQFGEDGFFIDLTDPIEEYGVHYKEQIAKLSAEEQKTIKEMGTNVNTGGFYGMPLYSSTTVCDYMQNQMVINKTWLDAVGMSVPTTVDELYNVLKAFKEKDPNGNGKDDEIPALSSNIWLYIINAFVYYDAENAINITDGKAWDPVETPEFRQAIIYLNKLVKEGLLSELSFTAGATDMKNLVSGTGTAARVGMWCGHPELSTTVSSKVVDQYVSLPPLQAATDLGGYGVQRPNSLLYSSFITKDCEDIELAMKFLDFFYTDEVVTRVRHGEKGVDWVEGNGASSFMTDSTIEIKNPNALHNGNSTWGHNCHGILTPDNYLSIAQTGTGRWAECARLLAENTKTMTEFKKPAEVAVNLVYTEEEYETLIDNQAPRNSFVNESISLFSLGNQDPSSDAEWDKFLKTLDDYENDKLVKVCQSAYKRQQSK